jgi:acetoin utilization protein AcuB
MRVSHLPIVEDNLFSGLISDTDILTYNNPAEAVGKYPLSLTNAYISGDHHIYEVIRMMEDLKITLLPVVDDKKQYLGSVTLVSLLHYLSQLMSVDNPGGIIILEINDKDYLLTEIAQIVESNDAKILGMNVTTFPDSTRMEVTLKLNKISTRSMSGRFFRPLCGTTTSSKLPFRKTPIPKASRTGTIP